MDTLVIKSTKKYIPDVNFNSESGVLEISGQCYMEYTSRFFKPIFQWLKDYAKEEEAKDITLNIKLLYLNTSSIKCLYELFKILEIYAKITKKNVKVNWFFDKEDDSLLETYHDYKEEINLPFSHIQVNS